MSQELPKGWTQCTLEECVEILDSLRKPINNTERASRIQGKSESELFPYYGATGQVGFIDDFIFDGEYIALGEDGVPFFDPSKHKAYLLGGKTWVNNHAHVLQGQSDVDNRFICYQLNQVDYQGYVNGATRLKLTQQNMRKLPLLLPPFPEQIRIADKLDRLLASVNTAQSRLDNIPALIKGFRQSVLAAATSGELTREWRGEDEFGIEKAIGDVATQIKYGTSKKCSYDSGNTPVLRIPNMSNGRIDAIDIKFSDFDKKELDSLSLKTGDILVIRSNGSLDLVGKANVVTEDFEGYLYAGYLIRVRLDMDSASPEYVSYCLNSPKTRQIIEVNARSTSGVNNINSKELAALPLSLPSLHEQKEIVRRVESLFALADSVEKQYQDAKARTDRLTQALLAKAFRGELVPQDPNDEPAEQLLERIQQQRAEQAKSKPKSGRKTSTAKSKPEKITAMTLTEAPEHYLLTLLTEMGGEADAALLWKKSGLEIDDFYALLKQETTIQDDNASADPSQRKLKVRQ